MKRKVRNFPFEVKEVDDEGHFSGYASVFGVIDSYREKVAPGAFGKSLKKWTERGRLPPALWQHRSDEPVGPYTLMREDERGLYVEGELLVNDIQRAREARALMKRKAVDGLSIGFNSIVEEWDKEEKLIILKEVDLWEVSIVTFPANQEAMITEVRSMFADGNVPTLRQIEEVLREAGFSRSQAVCLVKGGYAGLLREAEGRSNGLVDELIAGVRGAGIPITAKDLST